MSRPVYQLLLAAIGFFVAWQANGNEVGGEQAGAAATAGDLIVNCYDRAHNVVQKKRRDECRGEVVSDSRAAAVESQRRQYILRALANQLKPVAPGKTLTAVGSGFFVNRHGTVLTSARVVDDCSLVSVSATQGQTVRAEVLAKDTDLNLAILDTPIAPLGVANFAPEDAPSAAEDVAVVGYPDDGSPPAYPLLASGKALAETGKQSGLAGRTFRIETRVGQVVAGGPVLDQSGNVIGIVLPKSRQNGMLQTVDYDLGNLAVAVSNSNALSFLEARQVDYRRASTVPVAAPEKLLKHAKLYVVQVGCWK